MPRCCPNCYLYEECEKRGECCPECDFFDRGRCTLKTSDKISELGIVK